MFSWTYTNVVMKYLVPLLRVWNTDVVKEVILLKTTLALRKFYFLISTKRCKCGTSVFQNMCIFLGQIMLSCPYDKEEELSLYNFDTIVEVLSDILFNEEMSKYSSISNLEFQKFHFCWNLRLLFQIVYFSGSRALKENVYLAICELSSRRFSQCLKPLSSWMPPDKKLSSETLTQLKEIMNKKVNYAKWCDFISPQKPHRRFTSRKNKKFGNNELGKSKISEEKGIISVGVTRSTRTQTEQQRIQGKKKKKKKHKKRGKQKKMIV